MRNKLNQAVLALVLCIIAGTVQSQNIDDYFQKIRKNTVELTAFMSQMPKGGDLHNHYSGAVYAESFVQWMIDADYCINPNTLETAKPSGNCSNDFVKFSALQQYMSAPAFEIFRSKLIRSYSTKEWDQVHTDAREEHFFATFGNFNNASGMRYESGLAELKKRAIAENVSYIETMLPNIRCQVPDSSKVTIVKNADTLKYYNSLLIRLGNKKDQDSLRPVLTWLYKKIKDSLPINLSASYVNNWVDGLHSKNVADDPRFTMRYLAFITRIGDPLPTFINLVTAFETVKQSSSGNLLGINIVAPEDHPVSMRDYWVHMQFFGFCKQQYGSVKYTMHAGELTEGFVQPEELTWHISSAVHDAGAQRIGHGVDIAYEKNNYELLRYMAANKIPVEINLSSNEYILGVRDDVHPVLLYRRFNVPIVISTDDPGVSRSSLTEQYVLLAKRYDEISYHDIKSYTFNSIRYSFLSNALKEKLVKDLEQRFVVFEKYIMEKRP